MNGIETSEWMALNEIAGQKGVKVNHLRSSTMAFEIGLPETLTKRTRFKGFCVGNVTAPCAASLANFASRLLALLAFLIGWISAIGVPRSVTMTSSPCLACLRYSVRRSFSCLTPTVLIRTDPQ